MNEEISRINLSAAIRRHGKNNRLRLMRICDKGPWIRGSNEISIQFTDSPTYAKPACPADRATVGKADLPNNSVVLCEIASVSSVFFVSGNNYEYYLRVMNNNNTI